MHTHVYPFAALVGQEPLKLALMLNAINPAIGGVLIRGDMGTAKSTAERALAALLPESEVLRGCPFGRGPEDGPAACDVCGLCRRRRDVIQRKVRVVTLIEFMISGLAAMVSMTRPLPSAVKSISRAAEKMNIPTCLSLGPSSALRQAMNISICTACRALNTVQHPARFGIIYFFRGPKIRKRFSMTGLRLMMYSKLAKNDLLKNG